MKRPGNESSRERKGPGAKVPGSELAKVLLELSLRGANWPGSEKARYPCPGAVFIFRETTNLTTLFTTQRLEEDGMCFSNGPVVQ